MPREREDFFRESNTTPKEKIVVLAFEGNDTERIYFEALKESVKFNDEIIFLHLLSRPKEDTNSAPNHVFSKLKSEAKDQYNFSKDDELWMVIDTDRWKNIPDIIVECNKLENMYVAVSNPCFEFWLLLHIKDLNEYKDEDLVAILNNKKANKNRTYVEAELINILGSYNKTNPQPDRFIPNILFAMIQAKTLDTPLEVYPTRLGSHIYKIVEKIAKP